MGQQEVGNRKSQGKCRSCEKDYPDGKDDQGGKTSCPAFGKMCNACGKPNHFQVVCRSKRSTKGSGRHAQLRVVDDEEHSSEDDVYLFAVRSNYKEEKPIIQVKVNSTPLALMADSGATINVLDETDYRKLADPLKLKSTNIKTYAYQSDKPLHVLGKFSATIESKSKRVEDTLYVVKGSGGSLLSWKMSRDLNLLQTVQQINEVPRPKPAQLVAEYDELFHGLGKLRNYQIKLHVDQTVPPVAQPHRRIPFHVREHLKEQLKRDEELGVIERIEGPTPWVSPIVVVPKPKSPGKVRVCVDMRPANRAIRRERHASPTMKEIIRDLKGAKVFSKLDLNQCCNQLELAPESSYITTFSTHLELMRYTRLNFGVCSAAEIFQNVIRETLEGINGAINISDVILVFGKSQEKHEQNLRCVFQRLKENGLTLNRSNCEFSKGLSFLVMCFQKMVYLRIPRKWKILSIFRHQRMRQKYGVFLEWSIIARDLFQTTPQRRSLCVDLLIKDNHGTGHTNSSAR